MKPPTGPETRSDPKAISGRAGASKSDRFSTSNTGALSETFGTFRGWNIVP